MYPDNWPRCTFCDAPALDGHLTCGDVNCNENAARANAEARCECGARDPSECTCTPTFLDNLARRRRED